MEKYHLIFRSIDQILEFVNWGERIDKTMDIQTGSLYIDAKSLMGILAMGLNRDVTLSVQGTLEECDKSFLKSYQA